MINLNKFLIIFLVAVLILVTTIVFFAPILSRVLDGFAIGIFWPENKLAPSGVTGEKNTPQNPVDIVKITNEEIIQILRENKDGMEYTEKNPDFTIEKKTILTKDDILEGQNGQSFKEVYQGLSLEDNRYLKIDLMNTAGNNGLIAVLDSKTGEIVKAYGLLILSGKAEIKE